MAKPTMKAKGVPRDRSSLSSCRERSISSLAGGLEMG